MTRFITYESGSPTAVLISLLKRIADVACDAATMEWSRFVRGTTAYLWLPRLADRLWHLVVQFEAGRLKPLRPRPPAAPEPTAPEPTALEPVAPKERPPRERNPATELPRRRGWLIAGLPQPDRLLARLQAAFESEEWQRRFRAEPARFARLLRPVCFALGIDLPAPLTLPAAPRRAEAPRRTAPPTLHRTHFAPVGPNAPPDPGVPPSLRHLLFAKT